MNYIIRTYISSDEANLKQCISELKKFESQYDPDYLTDEDSIEKLFKDITIGKENGGEIIVAEDKGKIIGFVSLIIGTKNDELIVKKVKTIYISDIVVLSDYRNRGIGKKLLESANEFTMKNNIKYLKLIVFGDNQSARKLYESMGFKNYEITMLKEV